jgi:putative oxidoreductase
MVVITLPRARLLRAAEVGSRASLPLLRGSLGIVFIWFGALKLTQSTPIAELVAATVPFLPESWFVPTLGAFEVLIGLALLVGRWIGIVVALMVAHLAGTFLVLVMQPDVVFQHDNPFLLTMTGEFVVKNVVLIAAGIVLAGSARQAKPEVEPG